MKQAKREPVLLSPWGKGQGRGPRGQSAAGRRALPAVMALLALAVPAPAQEKSAAGLRLKVLEVARSIDLSRGNQEFFTVVVEITGTEPAGLRRVQPFREDFRLLAGKTSLPCRWLRGGSLPEDPHRLRFTLGFSPPPRGVKTVSFWANLPRLEGEDGLDLRLTDLLPGGPPQERKGTGWALSVTQFAERPYTVPELPPRGKFFSKAGPSDARVFRKESPGDAAPERAVVLSFQSTDPDLFDPTLDVTGQLLVEDGPPAPLLAAYLRRDPARGVKSPLPVNVVGEFYFAVPPKGRAAGAVIRLLRRPPQVKSQPVLVDGLPAQGR